MEKKQLLWLGSGLGGQAKLSQVGTIELQSEEALLLLIVGPLYLTFYFSSWHKMLPLAPTKVSFANYAFIYNYSSFYLFFSIIVQGVMLKNYSSFEYS